MRNKYKKSDKYLDYTKQSSTLEKNHNFSSAYNLKRTKSPKNLNSTIEKNKPISSKFNRNIVQKEKENYTKEENHKEFIIKKIHQIKDKENEQKNKNINHKNNYKDLYNNCSNINLNHFISNDATNSNNNKKGFYNNKKIEEDLKQINESNNNHFKRGEKIMSSEKYMNNFYKNNNSSSSNISKLLSYNEKSKNINKLTKINENNNINIKKSDKNKINEGLNFYINNNNENINNKNDNNKDSDNNYNKNTFKKYIIKRKHNFLKIDKQNNNNYLNQTNKTRVISKNNNFENNYETDNNNSNSIINKYIYKKDKMLKNLKEIEKRDTLNQNVQKNCLEIKAESSLTNRENNINEEKNTKDNVSETSSFKGNKLLNWNIKPKQSFQFLIHHISKNKELSNSFHKYYESNHLRPRGISQGLSDRDDSINTNTDEKSDEHKFRNLSLLKSSKFNEGESFSSLNINNYNENKFNYLTDRKIENKIFNNDDINNMKVINFNYIKSQVQDNNLNNQNNQNDIINKIKNNNSSIITNNIINNNVYNTTLNFYKISNICKSKYIYGKKPKNLSSKNLMENDAIIYEDETSMNNFNNRNIIHNLNNNLNNNNCPTNHDDNFTIMSLSSTSSSSMPLINLEMIFSLEKNFQLLFDKINKYQICDKECLDFILFFFDNKFYEEETKIFKNKHNKKNFLYNIKIEILCFFLCYDISYSKNFNQAAILLKSIFNIIHSNFLIFISYIINIYQLINNIDDNNKKILNDLQKIIDEKLKIHLIKQDMNEYNILQIITNNSKNINNYYKMIIDNLYGQDYISDDNDIKFPKCLKNKYIISSKLNQNKLNNIVSAFFFDAYRLLTNYDFNDLYDFFKKFLNQTQNNINEINDKSIDINNNETKYDKLNQNNYNEYNIIQNNTNKNKIEKYLLPKLKRYYKYSLVLDLDETLICIKRDSNDNIKLNKNNLIALILRPGLLDFLHKMKQIYELILFSSGTFEYVTPIIKNIEKKEKYFEHILYRQHVTYDECGNFFKNLNLLNRNVKNILIVDNSSNNFKYHKSNGICIKPFYGDVSNDKNLLKILGNILYKIRYDADITGDIRISLNKEKNNIIYSQITHKI